MDPCTVLEQKPVDPIPGSRQVVAFWTQGLRRARPVPCRLPHCGAKIKDTPHVWFRAWHALFVQGRRSSFFHVIIHALSHVTMSMCYSRRRLFVPSAVRGRSWPFGQTRWMAQLVNARSSPFEGLNGLDARAKRQVGRS